MSDRPEPDRLPDAPHPRETARVFGHDPALAQVAQAIEGGRMHHGWLLTGPRGTGKATLGWAMARQLLARQPDDMFAAPVPRDLTLDPGHPVARRVLALSEPRLALIRRPFDDKLGRLKTEIPVDTVRALKRFFALSAADGGTRVVIVDAADDLNTSAANALLKLLEEPPPDCVLILISHQPARLLPTIRSRCRTLRLSPLAPEDLARALAATGAEVPADGPGRDRLARLAGGSVGRALGLTEGGGLGLYDRLMALFATLPDHDRPMALTLADALGAREAEAERDLARDLIALILSDLARAGVTGAVPQDLPPPAQAMLRRLSPDQTAARAWAEALPRIDGRMAHGLAVNLDPASLILDMVATLDATASRALFQTGPM